MTRDEQIAAASKRADEYKFNINKYPVLAKGEYEEETEEMPDEIWAISKTWCGNPGSKVTNTINCIDADDSPRGIKYIRADKSLNVEWLENLKHSESSEKNGYYCAGFNESIDAIIRHIRGGDDPR